MKFWVTVLVAAVLALLAWVLVAERRSDALVVYCAHDLNFAQSILDDFERETGIPVVVVGDTEATKSLGLVQRLLAEKDHPRCDVFWNNQTLGTMQLAEAGVLEPYQGSGFERIPDRFKDPQGRWVGFAGRLRVWIVNTLNGPSPDEATLQARLDQDDLSEFTIAEPLFGTTLSHFTILWDHWGPDRLKSFHEKLQLRGCHFVPGNGPVKNLVAEGICHFGWTDTDDFFVGLDDGFPVAQVPIRIDGHTICMPNTVALVRGSQQPEKARQLVDYLLSQKVELKLARSQSRQIPLGRIVGETLPEDVQQLADWAADSVTVQESYHAREPCLAWLKGIYAP